MANTLESIPFREVVSLNTSVFPTTFANVSHERNSLRIVLSQDCMPNNHWFNVLTLLLLSSFFSPVRLLHFPDNKGSNGSLSPLPPSTPYRSFLNSASRTVSSQHCPLLPSYFLSFSFAWWLLAPSTVMLGTKKRLAIVFQSRGKHSYLSYSDL